MRKLSGGFLSFPAYCWGKEEALGLIVQAPRVVESHFERSFLTERSK